MTARIIDLATYQAPPTPTPSTPGLGRFVGATVVGDRVVIASSLDDEALSLTPTAARVLAYRLAELADQAEEGGRL